MSRPIPEFMSSTITSITVPSAPRVQSGRNSQRVPSTLTRVLFGTEAHFAPTIARVALGVGILPHGAQKTTGWFGGYGFTGTMQHFTENMHIPWVFAFAAILAESAAGVALVVGFSSRLAALSVGAVFATAVAMIHWQHGFFMNWFGNQKGEGIEYFLFGLALVAIVAVHGGGALSIDRQITARHLQK